MKNIKGDYGVITVNSNDEVVKIEREWYGQGFVYLNHTAYDNKEGICYIPELSDEAYTYSDILEVANGNSNIADRIFETVDWQSPESLFDEWESHGFFDNVDWE